MTQSPHPRDAASDPPPSRVPVVLVWAGTLMLGLGFYLILGAVFVYCGIIDLSASAWAALRRGARSAQAGLRGRRRRFP